MAGQVKMLVEEGCAPCDEAKVDLAPEIQRGEILLVDTSTEEARRIAGLHGVDEVPHAYREHEDGRIDRCAIQRGPDGKLAVSCEGEPPPTDLSTPPPLPSS